MILRAYTQRLRAQFTTVGAGLSVYVSWATISGLTSTVIDTDNDVRAVLGDAADYEIMDYADSGTLATDPNRIRKILTIQVRNNAVADRPLQFYMERTDSWASMVEVTPAFLIPAGGMLFYSPETGWRIYNADGVFAETGPTGPAGADGAGLTDGDKGDIVVSSTGTVFTIDTGVVTTAKMGGDVTVAGKALLDDADAAAQRTTLGLGTAATQASSAFAAASHTHSTGDITGLATVATTGAYSDLSGKPTLGTAAPLNVAASGNAASGEVVKGNDTRLSDARTPSAHTHPASDISDSTTAGRALVTAADAAAQRTALGLGTAATTASTDYAAASHTHAAGDITSGTIATARLGSGTANSTVFLRGDQTWAAAGGGGSFSVTDISGQSADTAADGTEEVPVNSGGTLKKMTVATILTNDAHAGYMDLTGISNPSAPSSGVLRAYAKNVGGRMLLKSVGPSGLDFPFQPALFGQRVVMFYPQNGTTGTGGAGFGPAWTSNGTVSHPTPATTAPAISNQMKRTRYANVVTTTNQQLGPRFNAATEQQFWRGNAAGLGGFFFFTRFIVELYPAATVRIFAGLSSTSTGSVCISDTVLANTCGLWHDTTDPSSGANSFNFVTKDATTATKQSIALSNAIAAGNSYDFYMFCPPNGSTIYWRLDDLVNSVTYENNTATTLPASTAFMQPQVQMSNGTANVTVTTSAIGVACIYCESDR